MDKTKLILLVLIIFLTSCAVGPDYHRPLALTSPAYKEAKGKSFKQSKVKWKVAEPAHCHSGQWWQVFNDGVLNDLENKLNANNQSVINAYYNYKQACALVDEARAAFFPTLTAALTLTRQKSGSTSSFISTSTSGQTSTGIAGTGGSGSSTITSSHSWLMAASWEPDIWGLVRRTVEASVAGAEASAALLASTRLSMQATLAQTYFELRGLDALQKLLNDTVRDDAAALKLTKNRYAAGVAGRPDVVQAQSVLEAAQAQAINNGILRGQYEHAIAVLIGLPPASLTIEAARTPFIPPEIPLGVPSELLERRPDIAQAERLMAQANAQIGVAVAAYYPTVNLTGTLSTGTRSLGQLFDVPSLSWSLGSQIAETIIDGGLRAATIRAAGATYQATVANYRQVVLAAFQNVEDNLISLRILDKQIMVERKAVASAKLALKLVLNQYKSGTVDYSSVITAQINAYTIQQNEIEAEYQRMVSAVGLIKGLGGYWE